MGQYTLFFYYYYYHLSVDQYTTIIICDSIYNTITYNVILLIFKYRPVEQCRVTTGVLIALVIPSTHTVEGGVSLQEGKGLTEVTVGRRS